MNTTIDFSTMTTPTPEPYSPTNPEKQRENFFYVLNQIASQLSANGATLDVDLTQAVLDLSFSGVTLDGPGFKITRSGKVTTLEITAL